MLETTVDGEMGDAWMSVEVPRKLILAKWDNKNVCWRYLRKNYRDQQHTSTKEEGN